MIFTNFSRKSDSFSDKSTAFIKSANNTPFQIVSEGKTKPETESSVSGFLHRNRSSLFQLAVFVSCHNVLDPLDGIEQITDGRIMIQRINDVRDVFAEVTADVPFSL